MRKLRFKCIKCGHIENKEPATICNKCGGILEYDYELKKPFPDKRKKGMLRYGAALPINGNSLVSLGEGDTPLIELPEEAGKIGVGRLYVKCEFMNPSASFKDRAMCVSFTRAKELGIDTAVVASVGNASSSAAAYGARSGISVYAAVPDTTTRSKVLQALTYGAKVVKVPGNYSDSHRLVRLAAQKYGFFNVTTTFLNPYNVAGCKTLGYELAEQLGEAPDWIMVPIGAGPLIAAVYRAFCDMQELGIIRKMPRLVGIQSDRCYPTVKAFIDGADHVSEWHMTEKTIASGINDELKGYTQDGDYSLNIIRKTNGWAVALSEVEIIESTLRLGRCGFYTEPASASGLVAAQKLRGENIIGPNDCIVMIATGNGLKNPIQELPFDPVTINEPEGFIDIIK